MARDRLQHLRGNDCSIRLVVDPVEELQDLGLRKEEAEVLVPLAVDGHADAVQQRTEHDHDLGVVALEAVVRDHRRLDAALREQPEQAERDVGHDLDVNPGVVVDPEPLDGVHVRDVPPRLEPVVGVDPLQQRPQLAVSLRRDLDAHLRDGLGRRETRLALGLLRSRLVDPLTELLVELRHGSRPYSLRLRPVTI